MLKLEDLPPGSSLGERLSAGVRNLWKVVNWLRNRSDDHETRIGKLERANATLRKERQGLLISRGKWRARAKLAAPDQPPLGQPSKPH